MSQAVPYGPKPWQQGTWDYRAATNFACGGLGAGLVVAAAVSGLDGPALAWPMLIGLAIVGCGLTAVFLELGRPLRAANVIRNPRTSWMTREALVAPLLFASGIAAAATGRMALAALAAVLALVFVWCQGRMLRAARGIPAWRAAELPALFVTTSLAEGLGLWLAIAAFLDAASMRVAGLLALAVVARLVVYRIYRRSVNDGLAPGAAKALEAAGRELLIVGTIVVLVLLALAVAVSPAGLSRWLALGAGLAAAVAGVRMKASLVLRAGYTQGFALPVLPVRGVRL